MPSSGAQFYMVYRTKVRMGGTSGTREMGEQNPRKTIEKWGKPEKPRKAIEKMENHRKTIGKL